MQSGPQKVPGGSGARWGGVQVVVETHYNVLNFFVKALEDTQLYALELWDAKEKDLANEGNAILALVSWRRLPHNQRR